MKKIILSLMLIIFLSGCDIYNLNLFTISDDAEFLALIQELDTPQKICSYIEENFAYKRHVFYTPDPYTLWKTKKGDCNDFSCFSVFVANYHSYETYQIRLYFNLFYSHMFPVFKEGDKYSFINNYEYFSPQYNNFIEMVEEVSYYFYSVCIHYKVYDYDLNIIEQN